MYLSAATRLLLIDLLPLSFQVPQLICGSTEPEPPLTIGESQPPPCMEPAVGVQQPADEREGKDAPTGKIQEVQEPRYIDRHGGWGG